MDSAAFFLFLLLGLTVIMASYALDYLFAWIAPARTFYFAVRVPGVVLHELSHALGCIITGAEVVKIVLFSEGGGSVSHGEPRVPFIGPVIISTAPLIFLPLILLILNWIFSFFFGVYLPEGFLTIPEVIPLNQPVTLLAGIFTENLILHFNGWFLLYLYLVTSIVLSLAPSTRDLKNAAVGAALLIVACLAILNSGNELGIVILERLLAPITNALIFGFFFELIVAGVSLPLILMYTLIMLKKREFT